MLEMLVTVAIAALLVTGAVQAYLGITRSQERAQGGMQRNRYAEVFLDRLERELSGTLLIVKPEEEDRLAHPYLFVGVDRFDSEHDIDALRFVTQTPARAARTPHSGGLRMVSYAVLPSADLEGLSLMRQEEELPSGMQKTIELSAGELVLDDIGKLQVRYLNEQTGEWGDNWDSTDIATLDQLPFEVEVTLALYERDELGERLTGEDHTRRIPIPVREIDLAALRAAAYGAGEQECITVAECVARFPELELDEDMEERILNAGEVCWDDGSEIAARLRILGADTKLCIQ
jgi:type II secretion system protein J